MTAAARLLNGDSLEILPRIPSDSYDAVITDPPYELGFMGKSWDSTGIAYNVELWSECLRVLKPGGHLLAFGGSRTWHRLAVAIEDAGFEMRDSIAWLYGNGFPKTRHSLKPAFEPIVLARKPFKVSVAANVQTHGTGALNIDACMVGADGGARRGPEDIGVRGRPNEVLGAGLDLGNAAPRIAGLGRRPTNVVLDDNAAKELGDPAKFFPTFKYQARAPRSERPSVDGVSHPTVKPLDLMRWLVKLVVPPGGLVLDPFAGSGATVEACLLEGVRCNAIEQEPTYIPLIEQRIQRCA